MQPNGTNITVSIHNLEEYVNLVAKTYLITGVHAQMVAFQEGFNLVFPLDHLRIFSVSEVETLICGAVTGSDEDWSIECMYHHLLIQVLTSYQPCKTILSAIMDSHHPAKRCNFCFPSCMSLTKRSVASFCSLLLALHGCPSRASRVLCQSKYFMSHSSDANFFTG